MANIYEHLPRTIACDFDGTLAEDKYPEIGEPIWQTILCLKHEQNRGAKIILWTNRTHEPLKAAVAWCESQGIYFDAVNNNIQEVILAFKCNPRKVFANEYWDDRMVHLPHLTHPDGSKHG